MTISYKEMNGSHRLDEYDTMMKEEIQLNQTREALEAQQETISSLNRDIALENVARTLTTQEKETIKTTMIAIISHRGHANTDDLHEALEKTHTTLKSPQVIGWIIRELINEEKIRFIGWTKSRRPEAHRRDIKNYQLREQK